MAESACPFVWHDLMTSDTAAAKAFYSKVFGWSLQAYPAGSEYTVVSAGSVGVGGIMPIPAAALARALARTRCNRRSRARADHKDD